MRSAHRIAMTAPLVLALFAGCPEPDIGTFTTLGPIITVAPDPIEFGDQAVPLSTSTTFHVSNGGKAPLEFSMEIVGEGADAFTLPAPAGEVEPGGSLPVVMIFEPTTYLDYTAEIIVTSNDEENSPLTVALTGTGVPAPLPDIRVESQTLDFGDIETTGNQYIIIENVGSAPLELGQISQAGSGAFQLPVSVSNNTVAPGNTTALPVLYTPTNTDGDSGRVIIPSNDPDEEEVVVVLLGNGGADYEYPIADIDCPGTVFPPSTDRLDGEGSSDPEGFYPLSYEWTLVSVPTDPGSSTPISDGRITNAVGPYTDLQTDTVGTYEVSLVVTNSLGTRSAPTLCVVEAIPEEDLLIELTWDTPSADLDLHLALSGNDLFDVPGDASFCNARAEWGESSTNLDDPALNIDDRAGYGPENFSIFTPAEELYDVRVHYFEDNGDDFVTATVRVYVYGELDPQFPQSRIMQRNETWDVARINWDDSPSVGLLGADLYEPVRRTCATN